MQNLSKIAKFIAIAASMSVVLACSKQEPTAEVVAAVEETSVFKTYSAEEFFKTRSVLRIERMIKVVSNSDASTMACFTFW